MKRPSFACALAVALSACSGPTTNLKEVYIAQQAVGGKPTRVLVIGLSNKPNIQAAFEGDMAGRLKAIGLPSVQGQAVLPKGQPVSVDVLREVVQREGTDAVLIAWLVGTREQTVVEAGPPGFYGYYNGWAPVVYQPAYLYEEKVVTLETRLYRTAGSGVLVWRAVSQTFDPYSAQEVIHSVNEKTVGRMRQDGVL